MPGTTSTTADVRKRPRVGGLIGDLAAGLVSTLVRAGMVNGETASEQRRERADLLITPPLEHIGMLDWKDWQRAIDAGYRHTIKILEAGARE